jgi:hypothetical protein
MISSALMRGVPIVQHYDLDATLSEIIDQVIHQALSAVKRGVTVTEGGDKLLDRASRSLEQKDHPEGSTTHETVS